MQFADLALSKRLEQAEGNACIQFAQAKRRLDPASRVEWIKSDGIYAAFDGPESPVTQSFGLGLFEEVTEKSLNDIERFFFDRGAPTVHEVSPFAGVATIDLLCTRNYRPIELSSVLYRALDLPPTAQPTNINVRVIAAEEAPIWAKVNAQGWASGNPAIRDLVLDSGAIAAARDETICFLAEIDGRPGAAGALSVFDGVALFAGASTIPELRGKGLQAALLAERIRYAHNHDCDLTMMVTEVGSTSQRNAERAGFRIAYTRTKWKLSKVQ
ncbi:MAG TPA: GNAT family N-acetyltransferase [Acidisarcina sp.]